MLKLNTKCKVCQAIIADKQLEKDIFNTTYYLKNTHITLRGLHNRVLKEQSADFSYESLVNHVHRHQFMSKSDYNERSLTTINKKAKDLKKEGTVEAREVWDLVIDKGVERLEEGSLPLKASDLLKAAKDKSDYELKVKDQQLAFMEMVYHFASGESNESKSYDRRIIAGKAVTDFDPAEQPAENPGAGPDRPNNIHYPPAWDAAAPGTD